MLNIYFVMKGLPKFIHWYLRFGVLVSLSRSMCNERCFSLRHLVGLAWRTCISRSTKITSTKQNKKKHMAKFVQFSWSLLLSIHVIQFLVVRADLCPIQMTPPRYHVAIIKRLLLHVSYLSPQAFMRTYVSEYWNPGWQERPSPEGMWQLWIVR